jgi:hypothetical protein
MCLKVNFVEWLTDYTCVLILSIYICICAPSDCGGIGSTHLLANFSCAS